MDIDPRLLSFTQSPTAARLQAAERYFSRSEQQLVDEEQAALFRPGLRVHHAVFGDSTVLAIDQDKSAYVIQFDGIQTQRAISFRTKLEKLWARCAFKKIPGVYRKTHWNFSLREILGEKTAIRQRDISFIMNSMV